MTLGGVVPDWMLSIVAAATLFVIMFDLGVVAAPLEFRREVAPGLMARALFSVLIAVPALVWIVARVFAVPRAVEIGMMLMAVAPGAPVALRRRAHAP